MQVDDLVNELLPRAKQILLDSENNFKLKINEWLDKKGFLIRFVGRNLIDPIWQLIIGPLLPILVKNLVLISIGLVAPHLTPFIPLIMQILEYIKDNIMNEAQKANFRELLLLVQGFKPDTELKKVLDMDLNKKNHLLMTQEYFDGKP